MSRRKSGGHVDIDEHPDLLDLRLSRKDERAARAEARRRQRRGAPVRRAFPRRYRTPVVAVAALAVLVGAGALLVDRARPGVTETSPSTTGTAVDRTPGVDLSQPFAGTPAAGWADGAAGIVPPAAAPVGAYTAEQVAAAYEQVRQVLVTARLDVAVLEGHDHGRYLALLAPGARASVTADLATPEGYGLVTRIADGFHLLPVPPKVAGAMWAAEAPDGALTVHTDYLFVYAFAPSDPEEVREPMDVVAVSRFAADYSVTDTRWPEADRGVWPADVTSHTYSAACDAADRGELAPSHSDRDVPAEDVAVDEARVFDPESPMPTTSNC
jgi:hypothetical protein